MMYHEQGSPNQEGFVVLMEAQFHVGWFLQGENNTARQFDVHRDSLKDTSKIRNTGKVIPFLAVGIGLSELWAFVGVRCALPCEPWVGLVLCLEGRPCAPSNQQTGTLS